MSNKATLENVLIHECGYNAGVVDTYEKFRKKCEDFYISTADKKAHCSSIMEKNDLCSFENCPISQKLLKAVIK